MQPAEYEAMFRAEETHWWYRALHRLTFDTLNEELPDWRTRAILDAGCGTGAILQRLGGPGLNVGVDLAPEAILWCRQRGLANAVQGDISALEFPDATFDAVICSSVLYHEWVADVPAALQELRRVLRPGGLLLLNLPACRFLHSAHDVAVMTARRFTRQEVVALLETNGFADMRVTYWTTLLFPLAVLARTFHGSKRGRDFEAGPASNFILGAVMALENFLLRRARVSFPFGVALLAIAHKPR